MWMGLEDKVPSPTMSRRSGEAQAKIFFAFTTTTGPHQTTSLDRKKAPSSDTIKQVNFSVLQLHPFYPNRNNNMAPPRRKVLATAEETLTPPDELLPGQTIARVIKATGNSIYSIELPSKESVLVELPARFRSTIWMKRGSYVVVDTNALEERDNKLHGEIVNIVRDEKAWRKAPYW